MSKSEKSLLLSLRETANQWSGTEHLRELADSLDLAIRELARNPTPSNMTVVNCWWIRAWRALAQAKKPRPGGGAGKLREGAKLQEAA